MQNGSQRDETDRDRWSTPEAVADADATRRDLLKANAALLLGAVGGLAGCGGYSPPDPLAPRTATWGMPMADAENTAANGGTTFPASEFNVEWTGAVTEESGSSPDVPFGVAMDGESVYATYPQGGVVKHDAQSGDVRARRDGGRQPSGPPAIFGDQIVVPEGGTLTAYGSADGTPAQGGGLRWTVGGSNLQRVGVDVGELRIGRSLTVDGESVVFAATDGSDGVVAAVDDQGQPQAAAKVELTDPTPAGPPVVTNGLVVVAFGSQLVVLDRNDLSTLHSDLLDAQPVGPPTHHAGRVLVPTSTGIAAFDATRDRELAQDIERAYDADAEPVRLWETSVDEGVTGPGARSGRTAVFPTNEGLLAVATTGGNVVWYNRDIVPATPPVASGGLLYCVSTDGDLHVADVVTGAQLSSYDVGTAGWSRLAIDDSTVVLTGARDDADSSVTVGSNGLDTDEAAQQRAVTGVDDAAAIEQVRNALVRTVEAIEAKTHVQVFPPAQAEDDDRREMVALASDLVGRYEAGEVSFRTVHGALERMYWVLRQLELTVGLTHYRWPDPAAVPDGIEAPRPTPEIRPEDPQIERIRRNVEDARSSLDASETGTTPHSLAPYPPADNAFVPTSTAIGLTEWSLMGRAGRGISRLVIGLVMFIPWLKVGKILKIVSRALPTPAVVRDPAANGIYRMVWITIQILEKARKQSLKAAREAAESAVERGLPKFVGDMLQWVLEEGVDQGMTLSVNEGDRVILNGDGIEFVLSWIDRLFVFVAAATYEYDVEFHNPEVENKDEKTPEQIRQEQVRPDLDRTNDSDFEGYTLSQTLRAVAAQNLFDELVDRDDLPGNREGAASATKARYRESLEGVAELYRGGQIKVDLIEGGFDVDIFDARAFAEETLDLSETTAQAFDIAYTVLTPLGRFEMNIEVVVQIAAAIIESVLNPIAGFTQWAEANKEMDEQLAIALESAVQQGLYGDHDGSSI